jgi:hypothetical protein
MSKIRTLRRPDKVVALLKCPAKHMRRLSTKHQSLKRAAIPPSRRPGYAGKLIEWVDTECAWELEIVKRSDDAKGFKVLPKRWVSERSFGWLNKYRLLSKEYEVLIESSEADIYLAMTQFGSHTRHYPG